MKIQDYRRLTVEDIEEDPSKLLEPMNQQFGDLTRALQGRLSPADNMNFEPRTLKMEHQVAEDIRLQKLQGKPIGVQVWYADYDDYLPALKWALIEQSLVRCTVQWDSDPGEPRNVTLVFWGA